MVLRVANATGFWGDDLRAARRLVESATVDYLTLEYLAELTMSILAHQKSRHPQAGFATDFVTVMRDIAPVLRQQPDLRVITNAGGIHPEACVRSVAHALIDEGLDAVTLGLIAGDDLVSRIPQLVADGLELAHLDTGQPLRELTAPVVAANAYLGAEPIVTALRDQARVVVTGRVADASLTVGPAVHEFQWSWSDWDRLAAATVAGHLIECGAQVTGGYSDRWRNVDLIEVGYPIAEIEPDGSCVITKPQGSGGVVDRRSVVEQLVYEIDDPRSYFTPDVVADFTSVTVHELGQDRVRVQGARGRSAPDTYKVSLAYQAGFMASAQLLVWGRDAADKAPFTGKLILERLEKQGIRFEGSHIECLGTGDGVPGYSQRGSPGRRDEEIVLRIAVRDARRDVVERFTREVAPLITNGPSGLAGYAAGRPTVRPVLAYWPTVIPKSLLSPQVEVKSARDWAGSSGT